MEGEGKAREPTRLDLEDFIRSVVHNGTGPDGKDLPAARNQQFANFVLVSR